MLNVKLFCERVPVFKNFTLCHLDNFDIIIGNTFSNANEVDILCSKSNLKICTNYGSKLVKWDVNYNFTLVKMGMNLVTLASELKAPSFKFWCLLKISQGEPKPQGAKQPPTCILDPFNKILKVLKYELPNGLPHYRKVNHKIKSCLERLRCHPRHSIG